MVIEISVVLIAFTLLISMIGLFVFLLKTGKILESTKKEVHRLSVDAVQLIRKVDDLVTDLQTKSDSLDVVFRPLKSIRKTKLGGNSSETVSEIVEWVSTSLTLFNRIKNAVKGRGK